MPRTSSKTPPLVANTSSSAAGKSCQSWIMISASISKIRKKERKFLQSASLVSLQRRLCLTRQANPIFTLATQCSILNANTPEQNETLIKSKGRSSSAASSSATLDAFVTVMRPAEKGHVDYTNDVSDFKKAVVEAVTLNGLPLSVFEASGIKKILQQLFILY